MRVMLYLLAVAFMIYGLYELGATGSTIFILFLMYCEQRGRLAKVEERAASLERNKFNFN